MEGASSHEKAALLTCWGETKPGALLFSAGVMRGLSQVLSVDEVTRWVRPGAASAALSLLGPAWEGRWKIPGDDASKADEAISKGSNARSGEEQSLDVE